MRPDCSGCPTTDHTFTVGRLRGNDMIFGHRSLGMSRFRCDMVPQERAGTPNQFPCFQVVNSYHGRSFTAPKSQWLEIGFLWLPCQPLQSIPKANLRLWRHLRCSHFFFKNQNPPVSRPGRSLHAGAAMLLPAISLTSVSFVFEYCV